MKNNTLLTFSFHQIIHFWINIKGQMFLLQKRIFVFKGGSCQTGGDNTSTLAEFNCFMLIDVENFFFLCYYPL